MNKRPLLCVILAAGKGTRMKSTLPKVLHPVAGLPMLGHVLRAAQGLLPEKIVVVVGPGQENVAAYAAPHDTVLQSEQLGTGHAVRVACAGRDLTDTDVLVLAGDVPLVPVAALRALQDKHAQTGAVVTILGMRPQNPTGYGRLLVDQKDQVLKIVEELDCTTEQRAIDLCNSGVMLMQGDAASAHLAAIENKNAKSEYYLTDVVGIAHAAGQKTAYVVAGDPDDLRGVNDRAQLAGVEARLQDKLRAAAMTNGATLVDPGTVYLSTDTQIGQDVLIEPGVFIGPGVVIENNVHIKANSYLEHVEIKSGAVIGPFARIREHSVIGEKVLIGNFVEVKKSNVGRETKASHLTYLCDVDIGERVNIGVGANFSNWDGIDKTRTSLGDRVFVGANATIVSPVTIEEDVYVSAGSVITDNVPAGKLAFGRARQVVRDHTDKTARYAHKKKGSK